MQHPGGPQWLTNTRGHDITEAFEAAHIFGGTKLIGHSKKPLRNNIIFPSDKVDKVLAKYFVRKANKPRTTWFTFKEDGFYKVC